MQNLCLGRASCVVPRRVVNGWIRSALQYISSRGVSIILHIYRCVCHHYTHLLYLLYLWIHRRRRGVIESQQQQQQRQQRPQRARGNNARGNRLNSQLLTIRLLCVYRGGHSPALTHKTRASFQCRLYMDMGHHPNTYTLCVVYGSVLICRRRREATRTHFHAFIRIRRFRLEYVYIKATDASETGQ